CNSQFPIRGLQFLVLYLPQSTEGLSMRVAILSHNAQSGDAIGNQVAEKVSFFIDRGALVQVFVESLERLHPAVQPYATCGAEPLTPVPSSQRAEAEDSPAWAFLKSADLVIVEYGQTYSLLGYLPLLAGGRTRILFDYHGITPVALCDGHLRD